MAPAAAAGAAGAADATPPAGAAAGAEAGATPYSDSESGSAEELVGADTARILCEFPNVEHTGLVTQTATRTERTAVTSVGRGRACPTEKWNCDFRKTS
eukprot:gene10603-biopygen3310